MDDEKAVYKQITEALDQNMVSDSWVLVRDEQPKLSSLSVKIEKP